MERLPGPALHAQPQTPSRISLWPVENSLYGLDFTYHGVTGYSDAEHAERLFTERGIPVSFRQELDSAWTVRVGPVPQEIALEAVAQFTR